jgi:hypothetical protein
MEERAMKVIADLVAAGFSIDVSDGDRIVLYCCRDIEKIMAVLGSAEEDYYLLATRGETSQVFFFARRLCTLERLAA